MATNTKKKSKTTSPAKKKRKKKGGKGRLEKKTIILISLAVLSLAALIAIALTVKGSRPQPADINLGKDVAWGVDVSSHNGEIDWKAVSKNADFAFIRAGYRSYSNGEVYADSRLKYNFKHANKQGVPVGAYFYSQAISEKEAEEEAEFLIKHIKGYNVSLPVVIDFEYAMSGGKHTGRLFEAELSKKQKTALINAFCDKVRKAGYTPGIYASSYVYKTELNMKSIPSDVFIWVADYNKEVTYGGYYDIWQYSDSGSCDGINSKSVDTNYFYTKNRLK